MDSDRLNKYKNRLKSNPTLLNWADYTSLTIWQRIGFCRYIAKFNLHEHTVTQDLIYSFWQLAITRQFPVKIYQSTDEKANGNDIEIAIETVNGYILFHCQAKIVNKRGRYPQLRHKVGGKDQINLLIEYGKKTGGLPTYLFYNFGGNPEKDQLLEKMHNLDIEKLGCSVIPAGFLKQTYYNAGSNSWSIPDFYHIHTRLAMPFSDLFKLVELPAQHPDQSSPPIKYRFYTKNELTDKASWTDLAQPPSIGRIQQERLKPERLEEMDDDTPTFSPAFRILIPIKFEKTYLISN